MEQIYTFFDWLQANFSKDLVGFVQTAFKIVIIIFVCIVIAKLGSFLIRKAFEKQKTFKYGIDNKRVDTMSTLLVSVFRYAVYIVGLVVILTDGFKLNSVLAAAGIGGVALGLGAQSLIRDVISGFFIVLEDHYAVGDMITVDTMTGTVEEFELRSTKVRNFNGDLYIIPNGEIKRVTNHTRGNKAVIVDIPVSYNSKVSQAFEIANAACEKVSAEFTVITEEPRVLGITDLGKEGMNIRIIAKTLPNEQWEVERRIRRLVKEGFEKAGLEFAERNRYIPGETSDKGGKQNGR